MIHFLRCNDLERNPGLDDQVDKLHELSRQFQCYMQITTEVRQQNVAMERQLTLSHNVVTQDMSFIKQRLSGVTEFVQKNSRDIELLNNKLQDAEYCIQGLKRELNRVQSDLRRKNVKIDGIKEDRGETKLQALVYDSLPSITAVFSYAIGSRKLSANEQFFCVCSNSSKFVTNNSDYTKRLFYN